MSRYTSINLSSLPSPQSVQLIDYDTIVDNAMVDLASRLEAAGIPYDVGALESDPLKINEEHRAYFEVLLRQRINEAIQATFLAKATGSDLDAVCADFGIIRRTITPADPATGTPAVMESDDDLRARRQLAPEGLTCAGSYGAYTFFALDAHPNVKDVDVYGPESNQCLPGQVLVSVLSKVNGGIATQDILDAVTFRLNAREVRPLTDQVIVEACNVVTYALDLTLILPPGPDATSVKTQAVARLTTLTNSLYAVGQGVPMKIIYAAAAVPGNDGVPLVHDIVANSGLVNGYDDTPRTAYRCTGITVTTQILT